MSPTQRALADCKKRGWFCQVVEHWNAFARRRIDLFGCIDIVAICPSYILGIQVTAGSSHAARRTKALQEPRIASWVAAGGGFEVWSYSKVGKRGKRKQWALRREYAKYDPAVGTMEFFPCSP